MTTKQSSAPNSSDDEYEDDAATLEGGSWQAHPNNPDPQSASVNSIPSPDDPTKAALPMQKRRRVTRACDECRRKKIKCDGKQPCTHCTVYSYDCTYNQPSNRRRNPAPQYIEALEVKLQRAEAILKSVYPEIDLEDSNIDERYSLETPVSTKQDGRSTEQRRSSAQAKSPKDVDGEKDSMIELMVQNTGSLDLDDEGHWDFYGHSSGRAFLRRMREQLGTLVGKPETIALPQFRSREQGSISTPSPSASSVGSPLAPCWPSTSELPGKACARLICSNALDDACAILRFVHQPTFYAMFDRVYDSRPEDLGAEETKFIPLLYSALALGSLFATNERSQLQAHGLKNAIDQGTHWFRTARSMIDVSECRDLMSIQTLLFMILFLQSSSKLSTCYSYIGIVLRSSLRMGLHRSVSNHFNPVEQELRKRIFWCVRKLDTYVGAMLGLPKTLNEEDIDQEFPLETDDEYITTERLLPMPPGKPSLTAAFNAHTRIVDILAKTVKYIYPIKGPKGNSSHSYIVSHTHIREIEQDLQEWYENLPEAFRPGGDAPTEFIRIQHLLRMAYAHIEMFLYRPFLHYASQDIRTKTHDKRSYACAAACVSVARNIVHLASDMKRKGLLIGSYWFYMYTTFFAVIALVFFIMENPNSATSAEILRDAHEGKDTLAGLAERSLAADKCTKTLTELFEQLPERLKGARMNVATPKKRQAPPSPVAQPQMLQSAPEVRLSSKPDPNKSVRRSNTLPTSQSLWTPSSSTYDTASFPQQISQDPEPGYRRGSQDPLSPSNPGGANFGSNASGDHLPSTPSFNVPNSITGLGVPDLSAMMFPSADPFAYPNQPITTLENRQDIKQEQSDGGFAMGPLPNTTNPPYDDLDGRLYGGIPDSMLPNQSGSYPVPGMSNPMTMSNVQAPNAAMSLPGHSWPQQSSPDQRLAGSIGMPVDQLFGEDWGGWMNQGYRQ